MPAGPATQNLGVRISIPDASAPIPSPPGPVDNTFQLEIEHGIGAALGRDATKLLHSLIPHHRHGRAEEIARAVLFLASDQSSCTTGSALMAEGGMHI